MTLHDQPPTRLDPASLPAQVLCLAAHADDEWIGCGALLAFHAERGDRVTVAILTGDSAGQSSEASATAGARGVTDVRHLSLEVGELGACNDLVARIAALLGDVSPLLVYVPSPFESDPDHRAASRAAASALANGPARTVLFYGVRAPVPSGVEFDTKTRHVAPPAKAGVDANPGSRGAAVAGSGTFVRLESQAVLAYQRAALESLARAAAQAPAPPRTTAVVSTWNKKDDVRANLASLRAQTLPFHEIVVVDNASRDGTAEMIAREFPEVRLIVMPHDRFGACTTFNLGFAASTTELTAILDDDIVMPPAWLEKATARLQREPPTTAIVSTQVIEPGMPEEYLRSKLVNEERYMSTFRGCASLARTEALRAAHYYDERLYIYGNERDLTCRLLNLGYRVLQYPGCGVHHKTPFGIKMGKRSLYYHARNAWLSMLKYAPLSDLVRMPWLVVSRVILRSERQEAEGSVRDAVGTIGIGRSLRETKGAWWVVSKAAFSVLWNLPYCLKHREPVRSRDFELPLS